MHEKNCFFRSMHDSCKTNKPASYTRTSSDGAKTVGYGRPNCPNTFHVQLSDLTELLDIMQGFILNLFPIALKAQH